MNFSAINPEVCELSFDNSNGPGTKLVISMSQSTYYNIHAKRVMNEPAVAPDNATQPTVARLGLDPVV